MNVLVQPTNQIAAIASTEAIAYERRVSELAMAFYNADRDALPTEDGVEKWLLSSGSSNRIEASRIASDVTALATRIYMGEVVC